MIKLFNLLNNILVGLITLFGTIIYPLYILSHRFPIIVDMSTNILFYIKSLFLNVYISFLEKHF